jgi:hypothetical protein
LTETGRTPSDDDRIGTALAGRSNFPNAGTQISIQRVYKHSTNL